MRITDVAFELEELPAQPAFDWRRGLPGSEPATIGGVLRLTTDAGVCGEARTVRGLVMADIVARRFRDELIGRDPMHRENLWHRMWELDRREGFPPYALGLVDVALWDLAGKAVGEPVHRLLGTFRETMPAYASTVTYGSVEEYLDVADQCLAAGFRAIKLHAWGDPRRDADLCEKVRAHVGDAIDLMYDGSAGFDLASAVYLGRALSETGFRWYEEPMREYSVTAYTLLADRVDIPLLVGETTHGAHMNIADFITSGCATAVRTSPHLKAGVTGAMRIAHLAESFLMNAEVHASGRVQRHLCMAIPNNSFYESLVMGNPIMVEPGVDNGTIHAPMEPGI